jgi:hypothetical protein
MISSENDPTLFVQEQDCQMVYFHTKNPAMGKFWRALEWKRLVYSMAVWNILRPFGNFVSIWYIFSRFGIMCKEKPGNPEQELAFARTFLLIYSCMYLGIK